VIQLNESIECPWCAHRVVLVDNICPQCRHEVLPEHLNPAEAEEEEEIVQMEADAAGELALDALDVEELIHERFKCAKCGGTVCLIKEISMTGTGLSKLLDIQYRHFLFVSCAGCGIVEIYDPDVLRGQPSGRLGTVMDILFGS
jgi:predicted nucleic-acid-binding Zn-ribbon protein